MRRLRHIDPETGKMPLTKPRKIKEASGTSAHEIVQTLAGAGILVGAVLTGIGAGILIDDYILDDTPAVIEESNNTSDPFDGYIAVVGGMALASIGLLTAKATGEK